jgi:hypothetical protein
MGAHISVFFVWAKILSMLKAWGFGDPVLIGFMAFLPVAHAAVNIWTIHRKNGDAS